jgi:hypothetical protein
MSGVMISALIPSAPLTPLKLSSTKTEIKIKWTVPSSDGGATILHYLVYSNNGNGGTVYALVGTTSTV